MNTRHPSLLFLMTLSSLVLLIGNRAYGDAAQDKTMPSTTHNYQPSRGPQPLFVPEPLREEFVRRVRSDVMPHVKEMAKQLLMKQGERGLKHIQDLGFRDLQNDTDIDSIDVANPIKIYEVSLEKLRAFVPGTNVKRLLLDTRQLLFPMKIKVKGKEEVKSSMTLRHVCDKQIDVAQMGEEECWRPTRVGHPNLIRLIREKQKTLKPNVKDQDFLVSIPALNRNFLGYEENNILWLVPLAKDHHFTKEDPDQAENVFNWLSKEANDMDDSPR